LQTVTLKACACACACVLDFSKLLHTDDTFPTGISTCSALVPPLIPATATRTCLCTYLELGKTHEVHPFPQQLPLSPQQQPPGRTSARTLNLVKNEVHAFPQQLPLSCQQQPPGRTSERRYFTFSLTAQHIRCVFSSFCSLTSAKAARMCSIDPVSSCSHSTTRGEQFCETALASLVCLSLHS